MYPGATCGIYFRYDGKTLATFTSKEGLLDDFVGSMIIDRAGNLWFGHPGSFPAGKGYESTTQRRLWHPSDPAS